MIFEVIVSTLIVKLYHFQFANKTKELQARVNQLNGILNQNYSEKYLKENWERVRKEIIERDFEKDEYSILDDLVDNIDLGRGLPFWKNSNNADLYN